MRSFLAAKTMKLAKNKVNLFAYLLIVSGAVGLLAAFLLTIEKFQILQNPNTGLGCDLNPIIACGSVINTDQASAFGFPNPILGTVGFAAIVTIGVAILAGAVLKKWFWRGLQIGVTFGVLFVHWLIYQSLFNIEALCPYCMVVWAVTIVLFVYITDFNIQHKNIKNIAARARLRYPLSAFETVVLWYAIIITMILIQFWYYWQTVWPFSLFA